MRWDGVVVDGRRHVEDADRCAVPRSACFQRAEPDEDAVGPGVEPLGVSQPRQLLPDLDEGRLGGVVRRIAVAQDPVRDAIELASGDPGEKLVGIPIPATRPLDQLTVHSVIPLTGRRTSALTR